MKLPKFIQNMNSDIKVFALMMIAIFTFINFMPNIYVTLRDGFKKEETKKPITNNTNNDQNIKPTEEIAIICTGTIKDENTETTNKVVLYAKGTKFQKQENYFTMKALTEVGKTIVESQKTYNETMIEAYKKYNGFTITSTYQNDIYEYHLVSDYNYLDVGRINIDYETDGKVYLEFSLNQNIEKVKEYFINNQGLTCE